MLWFHVSWRGHLHWAAYSDISTAGLRQTAQEENVSVLCAAACQTNGPHSSRMVLTDTYHNPHVKWPTVKLGKIELSWHWTKLHKRIGMSVGNWRKCTNELFICSYDHDDQYRFCFKWDFFLCHYDKQQQPGSHRRCVCCSGAPWWSRATCTIGENQAKTKALQLKK